MSKLLLSSVFIAFSASSAFALEFHGYECTQDCSGHKAGYEWAAKKGVTEASQCASDSQSFTEGCEVWVDEQGDDSDDDDDGEAN